MADLVLALNAGSSSLKFALRPAGAAARPVAQGIVERIGEAPFMVLRGPGGEVAAERRWPGPVAFDSVLAEVLALCEGRLGDNRLVAAGHRVVHGGAAHVRPERATPALLADLDRLTPLAPLHEPYNLAPIRAIAALRPDLPQVACFDTAFHHTMPAVAARFAIPRRFAAEGIRRYGFHGLSYEWIAGRLSALDPALARGRVIAAHLGNGASLCAMAAGRSIDTTMGFTATDGLMMGTRSGEIDPGLVLHFQTRMGMSAAEVGDMLNRRSGLLGVSGISADMRALLASDAPEAAEAVALFVYRIVRSAGALAAVLGGLDGFVFTGGIGEHAAPVRAAVAAGLRWLGAELDPAANVASAPVISTPASRLALRIIPTDEEATITAHTLACLSVQTG